jgi:hypothetical protein
MVSQGGKNVSAMFKVLGIILAVYTIYAAVSGEVYAKSGAGRRTVSRHHSPVYFWVVVAIYGALSLALATIF